MKWWMWMHPVRYHYMSKRGKSIYCHATGWAWVFPDNLGYNAFMATLNIFVSYFSFLTSPLQSITTSPKSWASGSLSALCGAQNTTFSLRCVLKPVYHTCPSIQCKHPIPVCPTQVVNSHSTTQILERVSRKRYKIFLKCQASLMCVCGCLPTIGHKCLFS